MVDEDGGRIVGVDPARISQWRQVDGRWVPLETSVAVVNLDKTHLSEYNLHIGHV